MGSAIVLRDDFDAAALRRMARLSRSANQVRRMLALAQIYVGSSRSEAARTGGVTPQIVRDWVIRFNTCGPDGLLEGKAPGKSSILNDAQRRALMEIIEQGPIPELSRLGSARGNLPVTRDDADILGHDEHGCP